MASVILTKTYTTPPYCEREILRYAGCREATDEVVDILHSAVKEAEEYLTYKVCYRELSGDISGDCCDFGIFRLNSANLAKNLKGVKKVVLFAATVGVGIDRLIAKYSRISPSRALMMQAIGAERIEALCDRFCEDIEKEHSSGLKPRFSPGYGDLPLSVQKNVLSVLDCGKLIGVSLNDSLIMSPSKSVTAFAGIPEKGVKMPHNKCLMCDKKNCEYRSAL